MACLICSATLPANPSPAAGEDDPVDDLASYLAQARDISYTRHWREAQIMLDKISDQIDPSDPRAFAEFHLLKARHLVLADQLSEGLDRASMLLEHELAPEPKLRTLQFAANTAVLLRNYELAFDYLLNALQIEPEVEDTAATIATYNMAAYMFGRVGEHERAMTYGELAVERAVSTGKANDECITRQRLAPVFKWASRTEDARAEYRKAIAACQDAGNRLFVGVVQYGFADLLNQLERPEEAYRLVNTAIATLKSAEWPIGEHEARLHRAQIQHRLGVLPENIDAELEALSEYFTTRELFDQLAQTEELRARIAGDNGEHELANRHLMRFLDARERFLSRDRAMLMAYLQVEFDLRTKEQQIDLLREIARLAELEVETTRQQRRARTIILFLSVGLLALLVALLVRTFQARQHFRELSRRDRLSGLANHGWFFERADAMIQEARRVHESAFLVMADIDNFKQINDSHGHVLGDQVLGQISRRLREAFGEEALIGRIGGDEFAVLVSGQDETKVIEAINQFTRAGPGSSRADDPTPTLSFGVALMQPEDDLVGLRQRADAALYQAKAAGRDRFIISGPEY